MEFNKEEINLCKQVAERHRKMIGYGNWYIGQNEDIRIWTYKYIANPKGLIPLWTISGCLEWLMTKGTDCGVFYDPKDEIWKGYLTIIDQNCIAEKGKTPLEACLKAVLAVLEDSSG